MTTVLDFLRPLVRCKSLTPNQAGALDFIEAVLKKLGFTCQRLTFHKTENLYAVKGTSGPNFCFAGHVDVVSPLDETLWKHPPFKGVVHQDTIYGRGVVDMKGSIACYLKALSDYLKNTSNLNHCLSFLITSDEEGPAVDGTIKVVEWLKNNNVKLDLCIVGEPTSENTIGDTVKVGRRGSLNFHLKALGHEGHVAYPHKALNPLTDLVALLSQLKAHTFKEEYCLFAPTNLEIVSVNTKNEAFNIIPSTAEAKLNIRFTPSFQPCGLIQWIKKEATKFSCRFEIEAFSNAEAFYCNTPLLHEKLRECVYNAIDIRPKISTSGGTSDARFIKDLCPVFELGLKNETAHKIDEHAPLKDLEILTKIYSAILKSVEAGTFL